MPLTTLPPLAVPKNSTVPPLPLAEQQKNVSKGVWRVIHIPKLQWWVRFLVRDAFGQYLSIIIVVPFLLLVWLVEAIATREQHQSKIALASTLPRG